MEMTLNEAWTDFIYSLHTSGKWETLCRSERQYIDKTNRALKSGKHPVVRIANLFNRYAPDVYVLDKVVFKKA